MVIVLFICWFFSFFFKIGNTFFRLISFKNSKLSVEVGIWPLVCIEYVKFDGNVLYFCFKLVPFSILMLID